MDSASATDNVYVKCPDTKVTGKCGSIWVRLIPAPHGTGIVSAPVPKKLLQMADIEDCYTSAKGSTGTLGNFAKATYADPGPVEGERPPTRSTRTTCQRTTSRALSAPRSRRSSRRRGRGL